MKKQQDEELMEQFFSHFYDVCSSTDAFNYTMDEFYDDFSPEMHDFLSKYSNLA
tara:strand:- start:1003 stop:1164 length:162 start_codon:yes stop_codon:yes gene_type:complete